MCYAARERGSVSAAASAPTGPESGSTPLLATHGGELTCAAGPPSTAMGDQMGNLEPLPAQRPGRRQYQLVSGQCAAAEILDAVAELDLSGRGVEGACVDDVPYRVVASSRC